MDHFIFDGGGGGGLGNYQKKKFMHSKSREKNRAQWAKGKKSSKPFYS